MKGLRKLKISSREWDDLFLLRATPKKGDPWGVLAPLKGTPWEPLIPIITGGAFSHALNGHVMPLVNELGPPPHALWRRLPDEWAWCALKTNFTCLLARSICRPCSDLPECYEAPGFDNPLHSNLAGYIARAWKEGQYVVVVVGDEFSL